VCPLEVLTQQLELLYSALKISMYRSGIPYEGQKQTNNNLKKTTWKKHKWINYKTLL